MLRPASPISGEWRGGDTAAASNNEMQAQAQTGAVHLHWHMQRDRDGVAARRIWVKHEIDHGNYHSALSARKVKNDLRKG